MIFIQAQLKESVFFKVPIKYLLLNIQNIASHNLYLKKKSWYFSAEVPEVRLL